MIRRAFICTTRSESCVLATQYTCMPSCRIPACQGCATVRTGARLAEAALADEECFGHQAGLVGIVQADRTAIAQATMMTRAPAWWRRLLVPTGMAILTMVSL